MNNQERCLIPQLREFEVSIVARFLPAKAKLLTTALLNRAWHELLLSKNYAWHVFPLFDDTLQLFHLRETKAFLGQFSSLSGAALPLLHAPLRSQ